jgi:glycosyltransferase involved in cell wall biosynthesis
MCRKIRIALIADTFPPYRNSAATQLYDLSSEFGLQEYSLTVIVPDPDLQKSWQLKEEGDFRILRLNAPRIKNTSYLRRAIGEIIMPFAMALNYRASKLAREKWDGIIWYSPSIFHGPFVKFLKNKSNCKGYLIVRDIFPEWAVDIGLMKRSFYYWFFKGVAHYQYSIANIVGVQSPGNLIYFANWKRSPHRKLEVLHNWLGEEKLVHSSIRVDKTILAGRKIFVYSGNLGVAQGMDIFIDMAEYFQYRNDVGFIFVGRGNEAHLIKNKAKQRRLNNVIFFDEIHPVELPDLYMQCSIGIVALNFKHKSHNIPGKFLSYIRSGLPVLANVNLGNDLAALIRNEKVGNVCETNDLKELINHAESILNLLDKDLNISSRCRNLFERDFSSHKAAQQIIKALIW